MGRRNRPCLNQRWSRMDDKTIYSGDKASLARIIHDGSSSPTPPSPIIWGREGV